MSEIECTKLYNICGKGICAVLAISMHAESGHWATIATYQSEIDELTDRSIRLQHFFDLSFDGAYAQAESWVKEAFGKEVDIKEDTTRAT